MKPAAVILNGGQSRRMGQNKSALVIDGVSLLQRTRTMLEAAGFDTIHVSGPGGIPDERPKAGPLSGIHAALNALQTHDMLLFLPVDMPLIGVDQLAMMLPHCEHNLIHFQGEHFPLMLKNNAQQRAHVSQQLTKGELAIQQLIKSTDSYGVPHAWPKSCFFNANTQQQWQQVVQLIKGGNS